MRGGWDVTFRCVSSLVKVGFVKMLKDQGKYFSKLGSPVGSIASEDLKNFSCTARSMTPNWFHSQSSSRFYFGDYKSTTPNWLHSQSSSRFYSATTSRRLNYKSTTPNWLHSQSSSRFYSATTSRRLQIGFTLSLQVGSTRRLQVDSRKVFKLSPTRKLFFDEDTVSTASAYEQQHDHENHADVLRPRMKVFIGSQYAPGCLLKLLTDEAIGWVRFFRISGEHSSVSISQFRWSADSRATFRQ
ncbi:hypothetical protein CEXT_38641 [Caerostris extrusa]|uniref:Uncharacterized protein n=1 Tax=Caerostris extrusa TaxID=172846 RepID=A0AAV4U863_CAEEX|nr:hypothetical protein CEXT_38641 [Caerostris extrusa]